MISIVICLMQMMLLARVNAQVVVDAEKYYTAMFDPEEKSWNIRDHHFFGVLQQVMGHFFCTRGNALATVWAHNSHLGDARYTHLDAI